MITGMSDGWEWLTRRGGGEVLSYVDSGIATPIPEPLRTTAFEQDARDYGEDPALALLAAGVEDLGLSPWDAALKAFGGDRG